MRAFAESQNCRSLLGDATLQCSAELSNDGPHSTAYSGLHTYALADKVEATDDKSRSAFQAFQFTDIDLLLDVLKGKTCVHAQCYRR